MYEAKRVEKLLSTRNAVPLRIVLDVESAEEVLVQILLSGQVTRDEFPQPLRQFDPQIRKTAAEVGRKMFVRHIPQKTLGVDRESIEKKRANSDTERANALNARMKSAEDAGPDPEHSHEHLVTDTQILNRPNSHSIPSSPSC